jgi:hypothetical protein
MIVWSLAHRSRGPASWGILMVALESRRNDLRVCIQGEFTYEYSDRSCSRLLMVPVTSMYVSRRIIMVHEVSVSCRICFVTYVV